MKILLLGILLVLAVNSCHEVRTVIVALKAAANNQYVTAPNFGKDSLKAQYGIIGTEQRFEMALYPNNIVSFRSLVNGKYVCAEGAGAHPLIASRDAVGQW
jgi:hypothetical protein